VELLVELGISELTNEQIEEICASAEDAARRHVLSKVSQKLLEKLDISVEAEGSKPVTFTVEVDVALMPEKKDFDQKKLAEEAVRKAFEAIETYLRKLS
jgi:hypothetical protein